MPPRPYSGLHDLQKIQDLQRELLQVLPYSSFHPGDIEWWIFYNPVGDPPEKTVFLWEDANGKLLAWLIIVPHMMGYDLFLHPMVRGTALEDEMMTWGETCLQPYITHDTLYIECLSGFADHTTLNHRLEQRGYERKLFLALFAQALTVELPPPLLPDGYSFLDKMDVNYCQERADVHFNAFTPSRMTADYYRTFMTQAPSYHPEDDVVVVDSTGRFISFAMTWTDAILKRGEFEPVGTRRDYHRQGFGRAVMLEGLRRLKAHGMREATVCCDANIAGNVAFYESVGFVRQNTLFSYTKAVR